jgi:hypothetical protein
MYKKISTPLIQEIRWYQRNLYNKQPQNCMASNHTNLQLSKNSKHVWDLKDLIHNNCSNVREDTDI